MTSPTPITANIQAFIASLKKEWRYWLIPTIACLSLALLYSFIKQDEWNAVQVVLVRDEANMGGSARRGRFESTDAMKSAQETIQEIARNQSVLKSTLQQIGPLPTSRTPTKWPTEEDIKDLGENLSVASPKGTEFGQTEAIHLSVNAETRDRAASLATALCDQIEAQMQLLRDSRAASIIIETENNVAMAEEEVAKATDALQVVEAEVGSDLGELRILSQSGNGDSNLRSMLTQIETELRQARAKHQSNEQQHAMLLSASDNPSEIIATPNRLLEAQPALRRLKEGLIDAELQTAELRGSMSEDHPLVVASIESEALVRQHLQGEISTAIRGLEADMAVSEGLLDSLTQQQAAVASRLDRLANRRASYSALVATQDHCFEVLQLARTELAQARAEQLAARSVSVLTRLNEPQRADNPLGPSRPVIVLLGLLGGFALGMGLVFLKTPFGAHGQSVGDRCSNYLRRGRRKASRPDRPGRRSTDHAMRAAEALPERAPADRRAPADTTPAKEAPSKPSIAEMMFPSTSPSPSPAREAENPAGYERRRNP